MVGFGSGSGFGALGPRGSFYGFVAVVMGRVVVLVTVEAVIREGC